MFGAVRYNVELGVISTKFSFHFLLPVMSLLFLLCGQSILYYYPILLPYWRFSVVQWMQVAKIRMIFALGHMTEISIKSRISGSW
jgi:hypothetical protein